MKTRNRFFIAYNVVVFLLILNFLTTGLVSFGKDISEDYDFQGNYKIVNLKDLTTKGPWVDIRAFGASTSSSDNITQIEAAITYAKNNSMGTVLIPSGTFKFNGPITGLETGLKLIGVGKKKSILENTNTNGASAIVITGKNLHSLTIRDLTIKGTTGGGHGIYIYDNIFLPYGLVFENLWISGCGGKGIYIPQLFSSVLRGIDVDNVGDNAIEVGGGVGLLVDSCYVHTVASGKTGYRIYGGNPTLINCNGISNGESWGIFGQTVAEDGVLNTCFPLFQGCNIEDFSDFGIKIKGGGSATFFSTTFLAPFTGTVSNAVINGYSEHPMLFFLSRISSKGASYASKIVGTFIFYSPKSYTDFESVEGGTTYSNPIITTNYDAYRTRALCVNNIAIKKYLRIPTASPSYFATGTIFFDTTDHIIKFWDSATGNPNYSSLGAQPIGGRAVQKTVTADYSANLCDQTILLDASSRAITINLMSVTNALIGKRLTFVKTDSSANNVTIDGNGSETINGSSSAYLSNQWEKMTIESTDTGWVLISN
jgi:parallel beta helix pectate lyase-like protein